MGTYKADDELGHKSPRNGYDSLYDSHTYRDYILDKRPRHVSAKRFVVFLSVDLVALFILIGIIDNLSSAKEIIALIVAIFWLTARAVIIALKAVNFWGNNSESIKKGLRSLRDMFKE